jgi:tetratricopeptide (TPR) repeat protein
MPILLLNCQKRYKEALILLDKTDVETANSRAHLALRGELLLADGRTDEAEALFRSLMVRFPKAIKFEIDCAKAAVAARRYEDAHVQWKSLIEKAPANQAVHAGYIKNLANLAAMDDARLHLENIVPKLGNSYFEVLQTVSLMLSGFEMDTAEPMLIDFIERSTPETTPVRHRVALEKARAGLMRRKFNLTGDHAFFDHVLDANKKITDLQPWNPIAQIMVCKTLIRMGRNADAITAMKALPDADHPELLDLKMWVAAQAGNIDRARQLWRRKSKIHHVVEISPWDLSDLQRVDTRDVPDAKDEIRLYTVIRNEMDRLPWFLDYYRKLGVDRFFFIDNGSTDNGQAYLLDQPDVHVFWTTGNYAEAQAGIRWINTLTPIYSPTGWILYADVDEALVFPKIETKSLRDLTQYMDVHGHEALAAYMMDMFSDADYVPTNHSVDYVKTYTGFDSKFFENGSPDCPYKEIRGGTRRHFGIGEILTKTPLVRAGRDIQFLMSSHFISPAIICDVSAVFLHFKLVGNFAETIKDELTKSSRGGHCRRRYAHYQTFLDKSGGKFDLDDPHIQEYSGSGQLIEMDLIGHPERFQ